jgi:uncharacterized protein involved in exopolysaccharide biosynthesis
MSSDRKDQPLQQLLEYWRMIVQNKWWVFLPTLALTLASVVYITFLPNQYEATTTILVDPRKCSAAPGCKKSSINIISTPEWNAPWDASS